MHSSILSLVVLAASALASPAQEEIIRAGDQKKLAKDVAAYWRARDELKDIQETFYELSQTLEKIDEGLQKKDGPDALAAVADWERIFWQATEEDLEERSLKKGSVQTVDEGGPAYSYLVGKRLSWRKGPLPMILVVPDAGKSPEETLETFWTDETLNDAAIVVAVHPQGSPETWSGDAGWNMVMSTFGRVQRSKTFGFDFDRVFLAGHGAGFAAAASTATTFPQLFAGLIGRGEVPSAGVANFKSLPTYLTGGGEAEAISKAVGEAGWGNCTLGEDDLGAIWAWIGGRERDSYPSHLVFAPPSATARNAHWLRVDGVDMDAQPRIEAVADRESNTITLTTKGISTVELSLNDVLVDLDRPVRVVIDGGPPHEEQIDRNARLMIDGVYDFGDWGRLFVAVSLHDVGATAE